MADKDNSGTIDQEEFLLALKNKSTKISRIIRDIRKYSHSIIDKKHE